MASVTDAIILAGGAGSKLRPLSYITAKPLMPIANVPLLEYTLTRLQRAGIRNTVLTLGELAEQFLPYVGSHASCMEVAAVIEEQPLGTGGAIINSLDGLLSPLCLVLNGDIITNMNLRALVSAHLQTKADMTIAVQKVQGTAQAISSRYGVVRFGDSGRIIAFDEKPSRHHAEDHFVNAGLYIIDSNVLRNFSNVPSSLERELIPALIDQGKIMFAYYEDCYWMDIGEIDDYLKANMDAISGKIILHHGFEEIMPNIFFGDGVRVAPGVQLNPPIVIGANTFIGREATIGPFTIMGPDVYVGDNAVVTDHIVWKGEKVPTKAKLFGGVLATSSRA